jgi:hypothetical protein
MTAKTPAERATAYRRRKGIVPKVPYPCGTRAAAVRHRRAHEALCVPCQVAEREYQNSRRERPEMVFVNLEQF